MIALFNGDTAPEKRHGTRAPEHHVSRGGLVMKCFRCYLVFAALLYSLLPGFSTKGYASEGIGVGVKAGTLGLGVEVSTSLLPNTRLRGGFNYLSYSFDSTIASIDYEF